MTSARDRWTGRTRAATLIALVSALTVSLIGAPAEATGNHPLRITVLSNRADLVSGGDALVQVSGAERQARITVRLNGQDVTGQFAVRPDGRYLGLLTGLRDGRNDLRASVSRAGARIAVTNHPRGGPVF